MRNVVVAGVGMTKFGYDPQSTLRGLAEWATHHALNDAGVTPNEVGFVAFSNAAAGLLTGQECIRGEVALRNVGFLGVPMVNIENACASGSSALHLAWLQVASGQVDTALAIGAEKMSNDDKSVVFKAMSAGTDLDDIEAMQERLGGSPDRTIFMDIYADNARRYMAETGTTQSDLARLAVKSHDYASMNPVAQFQKRFSEDEVLSARAIIDPLTLPMCSPIGDGAAGVLVMSEKAARTRGVRPVMVKASVISTGVPDQTGPSAARRAAFQAYETAGIGPDELDIVELHDATVSAELMLYEDLGLCDPGGGRDLFLSGQTNRGGRTPVNPSGGLVSRGHPIGATGCAQIVELTQQLRGQSGPRQCEAARTAMAENGGGWIGKDAAAAVVTVLSV